MNFLVTGGAGFIGSHVCERLLLSGHAVWAFDDLNDFYDPRLKRRNLRDLQALAKPFEFVHGDLTDRAALDELFGSVLFDQVIHLAARAGVRPSLAAPALYQRVNVEGTVNVLEAARHHGVRKLILASSSSVYGVNSKVPFAESDPIFSRDLALRRQQARLRSPRPRLSPCLWAGCGDAAVLHRVRPAPAARPRDSQVRPPDRAGQPIPVFGDGSTARDYTYVTDILDGLMACTQQEFGYEIFNLGESQTVTLRPA